MLTQKEYLLLCEFLSMDRINIKIGSIDKIIQELLQSDEFSKNAIVKEIATISKLLHLKLNNSKQIGIFAVYIFEDDCGDTCVVCAKKEPLINILSKEFQNELVDFVRDNRGTGKCIATGLELGGLYASYVASQLGIDGIVFRAPSREELLGNIKNYVAENDSVGEFTEKVVFIKQKLMDDNINQPYSQVLLFDEDGKAIVGQQSEYSKFSSWFYNAAGDIKDEIWTIFFKNTRDESNLFHRDLYSIFLKADEVNSEGIENSLENTVKYIENELEKNIKMIKLELDKNIINIAVADFEEQIYEIAENTANRAVDIVKSVYSSVETILMGLGLFTLGRELYDVEALMRQFSDSVDDILVKEIQRITGFLENEKQNYLDSLSVFPEFCLE